MKSYRIAALLALSLSATLAHAARDEQLIQQTHKNQLAHDAGEKARQDQHDQRQPDAAPAGR
jgi:hypothetical protein